MQIPVPDSMLAALTRQAGQAPVLRRIATPFPGPGEVLVRVHASSVNPTDVVTWRRGAFITGQTLPFVGGCDLAGVVAAVGRGVTILTQGDAVMGMPHFPSPASAFAEFVVVPARQVARIPETVSSSEQGEWARWAGLGLAGLTAWQALVDTAHVGPGQRVLIHAASGGVGHLAVQLAVHLGAEVTAVTSTRNRGFVDGLGAQRVVDRTTVDWHGLAGEFDVVLDTVGGKTTEMSAALLRPEGILVALHPYAHDDLATRDPRLRRLLVEPDREALQQLVALHAHGRLHVHVGATYPLGDVGQALLHVANNTTPGKTVITNQGAHA